MPGTVLDTTDNDMGKEKKKTDKILAHKDLVFYCMETEGIHSNLRLSQTMIHAVTQALGNSPFNSEAVQC